ncbi:UNVERIFIED_CONTAM: Ubiquitin carboxyl-terminal hydrolase 12 [Sesamum latifolium]|uniref:ubiquitinyl hydrolase 1 n=1 Tax=Sesamum latifolium TaxID=2727402 RepID=A0AAW2VC35_9LAMI
MRSNIVSEAGLPTRINQWWEGIPFVTSAIVIVCGIIYLVCLFVGYDSFVEVCFLPSAVVSHFQVYRAYTAIVFHGSLLHVLFNMLALVPMGSELERIMGSIRLLYITILLATSIAILHLLMALVVAHNPFHPDQSLMNQCSIGFSGILFSMIVIETSLSGAQSRSFFGLFNVPAKWYVWILLVVFQLLMTNVSLLGHLCGILSGYAYTFGLFNVLIPGTSFYSSIESSSWLSTCVRRPKFIICTGSNTSGHIPTYTNETTTSSGLLSGNMWRNLSSWMPQRETPVQTGPNSDRFPGRGRTLGSVANQAAPTAISDSGLQTRLLDDVDNLDQASHPATIGGGQRILDGRPSVLNSALASTRTQSNQGAVASEEEVKKLVAMGFDKTQVEVAIAAADGDLNVAVEILMSQQQQEDEEMLVPHSDLVEGPQPLVEGPQPMEVAQADNAGTVENQASDEPQASRFTWTIENFSRLNMKKLYSDVFVVGGYKWRVLIFPKGNNVDYLSMYLDVADSSSLPYGWSRYAQFSLAVVNQLNSKYTIKKDTQHQFNQRESDWGFTSFMPLSELYDPNKGYLVNDTCVVEADVAVRKTLYHIPYFRKAVYHMPTTENDNPSGSIPLALQSLFYKLQYNDTSVATKELTKSFGWDTYDSFMQHDVQELNRVLCEKLEDKMKGTVVEGTIQKLFEGHHMNYIECINVDFKSTRKESFYDLQLDVKGCKDVYASFDKYVEVERLEGDNKYHAEEHGLQDAKKGVLFIDFPPVLQLQLKRFEYDFMRDTMVKINDRYEFPLELDLDRENGKYLSQKLIGAYETLHASQMWYDIMKLKELSERAMHGVRNYLNCIMPLSLLPVLAAFRTFCVLVHSGGVHGGHYYAFIRPTLSDQWYKFDDERVTKEDVKRALEEQYGGEEELPQTNPGYNNTPFKFTKYSNAYMLVYIRVSDKDKIICDVDEKDIAEHLRIRLKKEQEEKEDKRRYKAQAHLYTIIKVARDEDLREQIGKDIYFDLVDHDKVRNFRIQKQMPFNLFKEEVAKEFGIPVQFQRFWIWAKRQNHTYRPNRPLTPQEEAQTVGALREVSNKAHNAELKLFLEVERGLDSRPVPPPEKNKEDILLFFKLYDPDKEELRYIGRLFVKSSGKPMEILTKLNEMAGFAPDQEIELFEIEDGDIICFQKRPPPESEEKNRFPDVPSFLEYVKNRQIVHFRALERPKEDEFCLELAKNHTYDDVVERVAQRLGLDDSSKIRLTPHNCYSQQPKPNPIKYRSVDHLLDMLVHYNQISDILYYEVLDIPLPELQCLKTLKVAFHHATKDEATILNIRLPKPSTVGDVLNEIKTKVELSHPNAELRLLEVFYHKIYKIFPVHEKIENINDQYWTLRAEEIPEEEKNLGPNDRLIHVYHFTKETSQNQVQVQNFGEPFFLVIHEGETLAEVKLRIQKKLQVPDEEFSKWKFAFLSLGRPEYLEDSDIVSSRFQRRDVYGAWEQYLGLEHSDTTPKRAYSSSQNRHTFEKPVKIYN